MRRAHDTMTGYDVADGDLPLASPFRGIAAMRYAATCNAMRARSGRVWFAWVLRARVLVANIRHDAPSQGSQP